MPLDYLGHLRDESDRFFEVLHSADPAAPVPTCPDWDAADLLWHLTEVQAFWSLIVSERAQAPEDVTTPERPETYEDLLDAFSEWSEKLIDALDGAPDDLPVWTWSDDHSVGFIRRRQAHEALIHRLDAELAAGRITPFPQQLAVDGVLEVLAVMYGGCPDWGTFTPDGTGVRVVCTDTGDQVDVLLGRFAGTDPADGTTYDETDLAVGVLPGPPSATIRGTADDLDAWLWHRRDEKTLAFEGDDEALRGLREILARPID